MSKEKFDNQKEVLNKAELYMKDLKVTKDHHVKSTLAHAVTAQEYEKEIDKTEIMIKESKRLMSIYEPCDDDDEDDYDEDDYSY